MVMNIRFISPNFGFEWFYLTTIHTVALPRNFAEGSATSRSLVNRGYVFTKSLFGVPLLQCIVGNVNRHKQIIRACLRDTEIRVCRLIPWCI